MANAQHALIVQHPNAPVTFDVPPADPRDPPVAASPQSIRAAWLDSNRERAKLGIPLHAKPRFNRTRFQHHDDERGESIERGAAMNLLEEMVDRFGLVTIQRWLRMAANLRGQEVS